MNRDDLPPGSRYPPRSRSRSRSRSREPERLGRQDRMWDDRRRDTYDRSYAEGDSLRGNYHERSATTASETGTYLRRHQEDPRGIAGVAGGHGNKHNSHRDGILDDRFVDEDDDGGDTRRAMPSHHVNSDGSSLIPAPLPPPPPPPPPPPQAAELAPPPGVSDDDFMAQILGFGGFDSTKGKHVADNDNTAARGAVARTLKREYRQYMHRKGGFNKPLAAQAPIKKKT